MTTDEPARTRGARRRRVGGRWSGEGVLTLVVATLLTVTGTGLLGTGAPALWVDQQQRDPDGFVTTDERLLSTPTSALVATPLEVALDRPVDDLLLRRTLGDVRVHVSGAPGDGLFVGLGPADAVEDYLRGVPVDRVRALSVGAPVEYDRHGGGSRQDPGGGSRQDPGGGSRPDPPGEQDLWVESVQGTGPLDLDGRVRDGRWALVVMRPDGGAGVQAEVSLGATLPSLTWVASGMVGLGSLFLLGGLGLLLQLALPERRRPVSGPVLRPGEPSPVPSPRTAAGADRTPPADAHVSGWAP